MIDTCVPSNNFSWLILANVVLVENSCFCNETKQRGTIYALDPQGKTMTHAGWPNEPHTSSNIRLLAYVSKFINTTLFDVCNGGAVREL